jgi:hypothetical protein
VFSVEEFEYSPYHKEKTPSRCHPLSALWHPIVNGMECYMRTGNTQGCKLNQHECLIHIYQLQAQY